MSSYASRQRPARGATVARAPKLATEQRFRRRTPTDRRLENLRRGGRESNPSKKQISSSYSSPGARGPGQAASPELRSPARSSKDTVGSPGSATRRDEPYSSPAEKSSFLRLLEEAEQTADAIEEEPLVVRPQLLEAHEKALAESSIDDAESPGQKMPPPLPSEPSGLAA